MAEKNQQKLPDVAMAPGDESPRGIGGTGAGVCPACGGTGRKAARDCPSCHGTGEIVPLAELEKSERTP